MVTETHFTQVRKTYETHASYAIHDTCTCFSYKFLYELEMLINILTFVYIEKITSQHIGWDARYRKLNIQLELDTVCANSYLQAFNCSFWEVFLDRFAM